MKPSGRSSTPRSSKLVGQLYTFADRTSRIAAWIGGGMLLVSAVITSIDVILRKVLGVSLGSSDEFACYALAISTSWGISFTLMRRANIRIDVFYMCLPKRITAWLDLLALVLIGGFMVNVVWFATHLWLTSIDMKAAALTSLQTPLMIPQGLWLAGFALFLLVLLVLLARVIGLLARGDIAGVNKCAGIRSVEEEVADEVRDESQKKGECDVT